MTARSLNAAVASTRDWLRNHPDCAYPEPGVLAGWMRERYSLCPDGCRVGPSTPCPHGMASWWLVLVARDRPGHPEPLGPGRLVPHPDRLDPDRADYVAVMEAHHRALVEGRDGYTDPVSGLFALTARTLWERGRCCQSGCRHCPWVPRP